MDGDVSSRAPTSLKRPSEAPTASSPAAKRRAPLPTTASDPIAAAQQYSQISKSLGLRRHECHLCSEEFASGSALNEHLQTAEGALHAEHRQRMQANIGISKAASIEHRAEMERAAVGRKIGIGESVIFVATGDVLKVVGRLEAPDNALQLEGGRICKLKTEGQRWLWLCDWQRQQAGGKEEQEESAGGETVEKETRGEGGPPRETSEATAVPQKGAQVEKEAVPLAAICSTEAGVSGDKEAEK